MVQKSNIPAIHGSSEEKRKAYQPPKLVKLGHEETASGIVILPVEIMGVQGPS